MKIKRITITPAGFDVSVIKINYGAYRWSLHLHVFDVTMQHISHFADVYDEFCDRANLEPNYKTELERESAEWIASMNGIKLIFKE